MTTKILIADDRGLLGAASRADIVRYAAAHGLLPVSTQPKQSGRQMPS